MAQPLVLMVVLALAACSADPAALGITGPAPLITEPAPERPGRSGTSDSEPGLAIDPAHPGGATGGRYWRYN
jgi:hypothetical protein